MQGEIFGGLHRACSSTANKLGKLANKVPGIKSAERMVTPEGMHFNAADEIPNQAKGNSSLTKIRSDQTRAPIGRTIAKERVAVEIKNPVLENIRSGSALKKDAYHAFDDIIDNYAGHATKFDLIGGDGITKQLYQIEGSLNGNKGVFEWIVDPRPNCGVTHRLFIKNGVVTGIPNNRK